MIRACKKVASDSGIESDFLCILQVNDCNTNIILTNICLSLYIAYVLAYQVSAIIEILEVLKLSGEGGRG